MRSWLIGFVVFAFAYALIVGGIAWYTWPTVGDIGRSAFDRELSEAHQAVIRDVQTGHAPVDPASAYSIESLMVGGSEHVAIHTSNGHRVVLEPGTGESTAREVAEHYAERVDFHLTEARISQVERILAVLLIPLITFALCAWMARKLWNKLMRIS